jgi:RecJ-like exonuclease
MDKIICNSCQVEKDLTSFYKCKECRGGVGKVCKMCKNQGRKSTKSERTVHPFNKEFRRSEESYYNMAGCTKQDYEDMYYILTKIGYDVWGDVHKQFLDKHNVNKKYPIKYKKRKYNTDTHFLPDGSINPQAASERYKKTPST